MLDEYIIRNDVNGLVQKRRHTKPFKMCTNVLKESQF